MTPSFFGLRVLEGVHGTLPWESPCLRNHKLGNPIYPTIHPREMEGKKYKGSCGNRESLPGWEELAMGSKLAGASCPSLCITI